MACANAVGSNVFNIFLGIGLPMILSEITWKEPYVVPDGLPVLVSSIMLIAITILMVRSANPQPACRGHGSQWLVACAVRRHRVPALGLDAQAQLDPPHHVPDIPRSLHLVRRRNDQPLRRHLHRESRAEPAT